MAPADTSTSGKPLQHFGLFIASLLFVFLFLECALRIAGYNPFGEFFESEGRAVFIQPSRNPQRIFEAAPNTHGKGWGTDISINSHGFRGREYTVAKPPGVYRIVVLGDSITFGNNLPANQNYPSLLENQFNQHGKRVEVLNLGLGGYDTLQEVATLEDTGLKFAPDMVVLGYCINDIGVASGNLNYIKRLKNYGHPLYRLRVAQLIRVLLDRIELIEYEKSANRSANFDTTYQNSLADISHDEDLNQKIQALEARLNRQPEKFLFTRDYTDSIHIERLRFALQQLKGLQEKNHFAVTVLVIPYLMEDRDSQPVYQAVYQIIAHEMTRLGFSVVNPYDAFSAAGFKNLILKKNDGVHPNATGHAIMADALYQHIPVQ